MKELSIKAKTLTPLWTGGVDAAADWLHETGIIGSLRWWYEAIVRGLGGWACDPSEHGCRFDAEKYRKSTAADERQRLRDAGLCDVCQVFGATGWKRRFRVEVVEDNTIPAWNPPPGMLNIRPPKRSRGWYLPPGRVGELKIRIKGDEKVLPMLAALFLFLEKWGNLGAKPQLGYGVFSILDRERVSKQANGWQWQKIGDREPNQYFPDLRRFGFFRYRFQPKTCDWWSHVPGIVASEVQALVSQHYTVPLAPVLKNEWRFNRWNGSSRDALWMFGTLKWQQGNETIRVRSKVAVSWAYQQDKEWEVRGWAWLQKSDIAADVWNLLRDKNAWQAVIPVEGVLETRPPGPWCAWRTEEVIRFLEATR